MTRENASIYKLHKFVSDECPFGDQPVLPGSVGCGDRVYGRPYDCYLPSLNAACCASCGEIKTDITGTSPISTLLLWFPLDTVDSVIDWWSKHWLLDVYFQAVNMATGRTGASTRNVRATTTSHGKACAVWPVKTVNCHIPLRLSPHYRLLHRILLTTSPLMMHILLKMVRD